jgi:hypothetical protein
MQLLCESLIYWGIFFQKWIMAGKINHKLVSFDGTALLCRLPEIIVNKLISVMKTCLIRHLSTNCIAEVRFAWRKIPIILWLGTRESFISNLKEKGCVQFGKQNQRTPLSPIPSQRIIGILRQANLTSAMQLVERWRIRQVKSFCYINDKNSFQTST